MPEQGSGPGANPDRIAKARGSLHAEGLGVRGLTKLAFNPTCDRLRALTACGVTPATAARHVYRVEPREGQSPFAFEAGNTFEAVILKDNADRLAQAATDAGLAIRRPLRVAVLSRHEGTASPAPADAIDRTRRFIEARARRDSEAPDLIVKPRFRVNLLGSDHEIEPDALLALDGWSHYLVVEIKSYPDRAGKTDPADVRSACLQAAVGTIALRQLHARTGLTDEPFQGGRAAALPGIPARHGNLARPLGILVLRRPGSYWPVVRPVSLAADTNLLERTLDGPRSALDAASFGTLGDRAVLDRVRANYCDACNGMCALSAVCREQALQTGDPAILGNAARDELAHADTVRRAIVLMLGEYAGKTTAAEDELRRELQAAYAEYESGTR